MDDKKKVLEQAILQIEKQFGKGAIMKLGEQPMDNIEVIQEIWKYGANSIIHNYRSQTSSNN